MAGKKNGKKIGTDILVKGQSVTGLESCKGLSGLDLDKCRERQSKGYKSAIAKTKKSVQKSRDLGALIGGKLGIAGVGGAAFKENIASRFKPRRGALAKTGASALLGGAVGERIGGAIGARRARRKAAGKWVAGEMLTESGRARKKARKKRKKENKASYEKRL